MEPGSINRALSRGVRQVCRVLADAGESAWVVGGSVRDILLGRTPVDWDVATTARPERMLGLFGRVIPTGIAHGTLTVLVGRESIEVTTLRGEGAYSDGRRPDAVEFLDDIERDLARRDFTVNAIAWDAERRVLHDPFGGRADLAAGVIRAVGDPGSRFAEDGLRVLRAARFAATLGFEIEPATLAAARAFAPMLDRVSAERKREELVRMLLAPDPTPGLEVLLAAGLLAHAVPALHAALASGGEALAARAVRRVAAAATLPVRLAALLLEVPAGAAGDWLDSMRFDRATRRRVARLLETAPDAVALAQPTLAEARLLLARIGRDAAADLLELVAAEACVGGRTLFREAAREVLEARDPLAVSELAIRGDGLMAALGLAPGPEVGRLLERLLERVLEHPEDNRADRLVALAREILAAVLAGRDLETTRKDSRGRSD
jgi:tRNA nucleotidyltransferase/poly(A) polymerase